MAGGVVFPVDGLGELLFVLAGLLLLEPLRGVLEALLEMFPHEGWNVEIMDAVNDAGTKGLFQAVGDGRLGTNDAAVDEMRSDAGHHDLLNFRTYWFSSGLLALRCLRG